MTEGRIPLIVSASCSFPKWKSWGVDGLLRFLLSLTCCSSCSWSFTFTSSGSGAWSSSSFRFCRISRKDSTFWELEWKSNTRYLYIWDKSFLQQTVTPLVELKMLTWYLLNRNCWVPCAIQRILKVWWKLSRISRISSLAHSVILRPIDGWHFQNWNQIAGTFVEMTYILRVQQSSLTTKKPT